jgi:beta-carotene 3-hydroxylase
MILLFYASITVATFIFMEFVAWFTHKYVMHGLLWILHEDHHTGRTGLFERNDSFFLIFAIPGASLSILGAMNGYDYKFFIGLGITLYGLAYFFVHDIFIHQRVKWFRNANHPYFRAIRRAHKMHHKHVGKEHGECFGMLFVPFKYYRQEVKNRD